METKFLTVREGRYNYGLGKNARTLVLDWNWWNGQMWWFTYKFPNSLCYKDLQAIALQYQGAHWLPTSWILNIISCSREPGLPGEMAEVWARKNMELIVMPRSKATLRKWCRHRSQLEGPSVAKSGAIWGSITITTVMDYNSLHKIRIHKFILTPKKGEY